MSGPASETRELLSALHRGDPGALAEILRRHLPWIQDRVRQQLAGVVRWKAETDDVVQEAVAAFLRYGPRCVVGDERQLRALLARIVENVLRDQHDRWRAQRRNVLLEREVPADHVLDLDPPVEPVTTPSEAAMRTETRDWIRLALELLGAEDRRIIQVREIEERTFPEVAGLLGISEDAARMRFKRALARLTRVVKTLRSGGLKAVFGDQP